MNIEPAYKTHSRFVLALAVVVLGFAAYALHLVSSTTDKATVEQIRLQRKEQLAADFVAKVAASAWRARAAVAADPASNSEQREILAGDTQLDVQTSLALQERISDDLASTEERAALRRVLDRRTTMVSARDNVIQLRNAGEELRAHFEFSERFLPSVEALEHALSLFKVQQRDALSTANIRVQELVLQTARTLDVVLAFALTLAGLTEAPRVSRRPVGLSQTVAA